MKKIMLIVCMLILFIIAVTYQVQAVELNGENWFLMTRGEKVSYLIGYYAGAVVAYMVAVEYGYMKFETVELLFDAYESQMIYNDIIIAIDNLYKTGYYDKQVEVSHILYFEFVIRKSKNEI